MNVSELAPGLWRWTALHPDWKEGEGWEQEVGCVYYEAADATVLIDPLVPAEQERFFAPSTGTSSVEGYRWRSCSLANRTGAAPPS